GELAALVVAVPVIAFRQRQALGRFKAEAMDFGEREEQRGEALATLDDAELGSLLDGVRGIEAGIGKADHLCAGRLGLQQEGREVGAGERMANGAGDGAAIRLYEVAGLLLERITEGIVGGEEEPAVAA